MTALLLVLQVLAVSSGLYSSYFFPPSATPAAAASNETFSVLAGASYWNALSGVKPDAGAAPAGFGRIGAAGYSLELAYRRTLRRLGADLGTGADLGFFFHPNSKVFDTTLAESGRKLQGDIHARGMYLTPSVRLLFGEPGGARLTCGAGFGVYTADIVRQLGDGLEAEEYFQETTAGGYFSAGVTAPLLRSRPQGPQLAGELKIHAFDFDRPASFAPGAGRLRGPLYTLQAGLSF